MPENMGIHQKDSPGVQALPLIREAEPPESIPTEREQSSPGGRTGWRSQTHAWYPFGPVFYLLSSISYLLSPISYLLSPISYLLSPVPCHTSSKWVS
jgi:hypothetical protein